MHGPNGEADGGTERLVSLFQAFGGETLRDIWLFDQRTHENLYIRDDIHEKLEDTDVVAKFVDNERYGYITNDTYDLLYYADYEYTVRGFDEFEQFRTFLPSERGSEVGLFASFDQDAGGYDFHDLYGCVMNVAAEHPDADFVPKSRSK